MMIKVWADCLIAGLKVWGEVKASRKAEVEQELIARVASGELSEDKFKQIIAG